MGKTIKTVLKSIKTNAKALTNASTGDGFADNLEVEFKKCGLTKMSLEADEELAKYVKKIKPIVQNKRGYKIIINVLKNKSPEYENIFIAQPYNTQACPDFLIFCDGFIYAIEIKYSKKKNKKPMLNGNIPVGDMIYIFGSYGYRDVTFILGRDYIDDAGIDELLFGVSEAEKLQKTLDKRNLELTKSGKIKNKFGAGVYLRIAYKNMKLEEWTIVDWLGNSVRDKIEENVLKFVEDPENAKLEEIEFDFDNDEDED